MIEIRFRQGTLDHLKSHLIRSKHTDEEGALLLARELELPERRLLLITDVLPIPDAGLTHKGPGGLTIDPEFLAPVIKRARADDLSVLVTHSHPFSDLTVGFSTIDDRGERSLMPKLQERIPDRTHGAIVFGRQSIAARVWLPGHNGSVGVDLVKGVGDRVKLELGLRDAEQDDRFARQVLAFSAGGQAVLQRLRVAIVGLGGIGSQVLQNLMHLGVRSFVLIDHDRVEPSNLSRLVGATYEDALEQLPKVEVMSRLAKNFDPEVQVDAVSDNVYHNSAAVRLKSVDVVFCCTDTMVSRMVLTRLPKQYFVPLIDVGVNIQVRDNGVVSRIGGRVMVLGPDDPCLDCLEYIDHGRLTGELAAAGVVAPTPYVTGVEEPAPSVVSYNATLAGLAVSEFLRMTVPGFPPTTSQTFQVLDGIEGIVRRVSLPTSRRCGVCDELIGAGDSVSLPVLRDR